MIEYRTAKGGAEANGDAVTGLVTPFSVETMIGDPKRGGFREQVAPGAFKKTLQEQDVVFLFNHDTGKPLARTSIPEGAGSLSLREAGDGLQADAIPLDTTAGKDLMKLTRAKVVKGMSFGFEVLKESWTDDEGRASNSQIGTKRTIQEVRLHEVSAVTFPAYTSTTFNARDVINAARGVEGARAAKATYADLETCGECGSENEYGSYCSACGQPMSQNSGPSGDYCTSCGSELDGERDAHRCETPADDTAETRDDPDGIEWAAMRLAITQIQAGKSDEAIETLQASLPEDDDGAGAATPDDDARDAQFLAIETAIYTI